MNLFFYSKFSDRNLGGFKFIPIGIINEFSDFMKIVDETISVEEIKHIFNKIDNNKDDLLNFEEFNHFIES